MFINETVKALSKTLVEVGVYFVLFILPIAVCVILDLHSACSVI
jgi:hypothetical protein